MLTVLLAAFLGVSLAVGSSPENAVAWSRERLILRAWEQHPQLAVARLAIERAKIRLRWAGRWANPELEIAGSTDQLGDNHNEGTLEIAFSQRFPLTSRLSREREVRRIDVELAEMEYSNRLRQFAYEVDRARVEWLAARREVDLRMGMLALNEEISAFLVRQVELGEASTLDLTQVQLKGKLIEQELKSARAKVMHARVQMFRWLGTEDDHELGEFVEEEFPSTAPSDELDLNSVLQRRPDYAVFLVRGDRGRADLALAMAKRWDDLSVKVFAEREKATDAPNGLDERNLIGIGLSIPLPLFQKNEAAIDEARLSIEQGRRAAVAKAFEIRSEVRHALHARDDAFQLVRSVIEETLPLAEKNFASFRQAQRDGQASFLQVQQAQAQLLDLQTSLLEFKKQYELSDAELRFHAARYPLPFLSQHPVTK